MSLLNPLLLGARRFAAGVDVSARGVTLIVLSQRVFGGGPLRIEWLGRAPLARDALAGAEIVDRQALVAALQELFGALPRTCAEASLRCAMALPTGATLLASVPLARLAPVGPADVSGLYTELEPLVLAEAERVAGLERNELAVDWRVGPLALEHGMASAQEAQVTIAATARAHLEVRIECAAMAGVALCAMDDEAHAALRAMRHAAAFELPPHEAWVALWIGADGVYGWFVAEESVVRTMRFPALEHADLVEALRDLAKGGASGCAFVAGDLSLLHGVHFSLADIGDVLGCPVLPFECAPLADAERPLDANLLHDPACAVAFGLAMRGVNE
jgi:Tfp pilus assembly PilM family ATPase